MKKHFFVLSLAFLALSTALGQVPANQPASPQFASAAGQFQIGLAGLIDNLKSITDPQQRKNRFDFRQNLQLIGLALTARLDKEKQAILTRGDFVRQLEEARVDTQVGSSSGSQGSTSLTTKGSVPAVFGFAVEHGALTQTQNGTTITFRGTPIGVVEALSKSGFIDGYKAIQNDPATRYLSHSSFIISYDTSRSGTQPAGTQSSAFAGNTQQLSAYGLHYDIVNHRDPRDAYYLSYWQQLVNTSAQAVTNNLAVIAAALVRDPAFVVWNQEASSAVANAADSDIETVVRAQFQKLQELPLSPVLFAAVRDLNTNYSSFLSDRSDLLNMVAHGPLLSFEYTNQLALPNSGFPDVSSFTIIGETGLFYGKSDLTANLMVDIYDSLRPSAQRHRLKSAAFSAQLDIPLTDPRRVGNYVFSSSFMYKNLSNDLLDSSGIVQSPRGTQAIGQIKLAIPIKNAGIKIPVSVTFANRTEFIKEREVRGNIGITLDLDSLLSSSK